MLRKFFFVIVTYLDVEIESGCQRPSPPPEERVSNLRVTSSRENVVELWRRRKIRGGRCNEASLAVGVMEVQWGCVGACALTKVYYESVMKGEPRRFIMKVA